MIKLFDKFKFWISEFDATNCSGSLDNKFQLKSNTFNLLFWLNDLSENYLI